jgi:heme exporter protein D
MKSFIEMGGYALYVWPSFGVAALLLALESLLLRRRRAAVIRRIQRLNRMNETRQQ